VPGGDKRSGSLKFFYLFISYVGAWRSLVAHLLWEQGVGGSNPLAPTSFMM
jgi:hypothetical protein